ncbi:MAG: BamA/TamA family outer membrane protein [Limnobacter sp.]|nr:BamA/TamA family outer membrane protein [Limnobacter sp.]
MCFAAKKPGIQDAVGASVDHQNITQLDIERSALGAIRTFELPNQRFSVGINFQLEERFLAKTLLGQTQALVFSANDTRYKVDDELNPTRGYVVNGQIAVASENALSDQDFLRLAFRHRGYWTPKAGHLISTRFEIGTVLASARNNIPQDFLFRTGGANTVRGFEYSGIGVPQQGVLQGGRRLLVGSVEYTRWFPDSPWGAAVFYDTGDVSASWSALELESAIGVGARYRTPAGPIAFDIAKASGQDKPRFHFALGVAF